MFNSRILIHLIIPVIFANFPLKAAPAKPLADSNTKLLGYYREVVAVYQCTLLLRKEPPAELKEIVTTEVIWMMFIYWHGAIKQGVVKRDPNYERLFFSKLFPLVEKHPMILDPIGRASTLEAQKSGVYVVPPQIPGITDQLYEDEKYYNGCVKEFARFLKENGSVKALHEYKPDSRSK